MHFLYLPDSYLRGGSEIGYARPRLLPPVFRASPNNKNRAWMVHEWECPICGMYHDIDLKAAKNIKYEAIVRDGTARSNADGEDVSLALKSEQSSVNSEEAAWQNTERLITPSVLVGSVFRISLVRGESSSLLTIPKLPVGK